MCAPWIIRNRLREPAHLLRLAALSIVIASPLALSGCLFVAGAAAGAGAFIVIDSQSDRDHAHGDQPNE